jgi:hypothetical protein
MKPGDVPSTGMAVRKGIAMKDQTRPWESVFAGPEITAVPGDEARFEEKAADTSDQGRFED